MTFEYVTVMNHGPFIPTWLSGSAYTLSLKKKKKQKTFDSGLIDTNWYLITCALQLHAVTQRRCILIMSRIQKSSAAHIISAEHAHSDSTSCTAEHTFEISFYKVSLAPHTQPPYLISPSLSQ